MNRVHEIIIILPLLFCRARLFTFVARCRVSYHGSLSLDPLSSIVASSKAMQYVKLRAKGRFSYGCVFVIAPLCNCEVCVAGALYFPPVF